MLQEAFSGSRNTGLNVKETKCVIPDNKGTFDNKK